MTDHSEVVTNARDLAHGLVRLGGATSATIRTAAWTLGALADIVEGYDKQRLTVNDELVKEAREMADTFGGSVTRSVMLRALANAVEKQVKQPDVNAELRAACVRCEEAIGEVRAFEKRMVKKGILRIDEIMPVVWTKLQAAGHIAKRAVELADIADSEASVKANLVRGAVRQIESGDNDFMDPDEFKMRGGA